MGDCNLCITVDPEALSCQIYVLKNWVVDTAHGAEKVFKTYDVPVSFSSLAASIFLTYRGRLIKGRDS